MDEREANEGLEPGFRMLRAGEAAHRLGVSGARMRRWFCDDEKKPMPYRQFPRSFRVGGTPTGHARFHPQDIVDLIHTDHTL